jgi:hypothetical protein
LVLPAAGVVQSLRVRVTAVPVFALEAGEQLADDFADLGCFDQKAVVTVG